MADVRENFGTHSYKIQMLMKLEPVLWAEIYAHATPASRHRKSALNSWFYFLLRAGEISRHMYSYKHRFPRSRWTLTYIPCPELQMGCLLWAPRGQKGPELTQGNSNTRPKRSLSFSRSTIQPFSFQTIRDTNHPSGGLRRRRRSRIRNSEFQGFVVVRFKTEVRLLDLIAYWRELLF